MYRIAASSGSQRTDLLVSNVANECYVSLVSVHNVLKKKDSYIVSLNIFSSFLCFFLFSKERGFLCSIFLSFFFTLVSVSFLLISFLCLINKIVFYCV